MLQKTGNQEEMQAFEERTLNEEKYNFFSYFPQLSPISIKNMEMSSYDSIGDFFEGLAQVEKNEEW
jgi:hypothetical protein